MEVIASTQTLHRAQPNFTKFANIFHKDIQIEVIASKVLATHH